MRILFVSKCSPLHEGGAEVRTKEVVSRLAAKGHEVLVICVKTRDGEPEVAQIGSAVVNARPILPNWFLKKYPYPHYLTLGLATAVLMFPLWRLCRKQRFDLIREDVSPFPPSGLLAFVRLPVRSRIAVVHNLAGSLKNWLRLYGTGYGIFGYLMERMLRAGLLKYDRIVCPGDWFARDLQRSANIASRVLTVPNGVDFDKYFVPGIEAARTGFRLLSAGRLVEIKGHRYLVEAISILRNACPQIRLTILGQGSLKEALQNQVARLGLGSVIEFRPPVEQSVMPQTYTEFDFLVLPSLFEGLPVSLLEAMAAGLPIIATDIAGTRAVLDEASSILCAPGDPKDLADKIKWALENRDEVDARRRQAQVMARAYNWDRVAEMEIEGELQ